MPNEERTMTAPYVIRDEQGYWHDYQLPTAWDDQPVGVSLIVYLQPGETLDCQIILAALKPALQAEPPGTWYKITVDWRYIRKTPSQTGVIILTLTKNDLIQVVETVTAPPGTWGRITSYKSNNQLIELAGYVYLGSLVKV